MTEDEWLACSDPTLMLGFLPGKVSDRKVRLFACACCRRVWDRILTDWAREAVHASERFADGLIDRHELRQIRSAAEQVRPRRQQEPGEKIGNELTGGLWCRSTAEMAREVAWETSGLGPRRKERQSQAALLRCIVGNPFRPVPVIDPCWLSWNNGTVSRLAQVIYEERAFDHLPILADALEEAGCDHADLLDHCRRAGPHCPGCWAVDLLVGKE
jgi:hypothetical protein